MTQSAPLLCVLAALTMLASASEVRAQSASASLSSDRVQVGETVTYTVTMRGGRGRRVSAPLATGALELISRAPTLDATTVINGRTERRVAWAYRARRPGTGRIRPFRAEVAGEAVSTAAMTVTVQRGTPAQASPSTRPPSARNARDLFVRAEPSRRTAVVGQQVVVDYVLYFEPEIQPRQTAPIGTWDAAGAWREEMDVPSTYPRSTMLGGQPFEAVTIRRVALFPTRAGELTLAPMQFTIDLMRTDGAFSNDPFAPFFSPFRQRFEDRKVTAPSVTVDVQSLPAGAPPSFTGAVGDFSLTTTVDEQRVEAGEPVRVRVAIRGDGNVALLEAPVLDAPAGFDAYDPREERESFRSSEPLLGVKTFTYTFVPQGGGSFDIPAAPFTYFDPATGRYRTLETTPFDIVVDGAALADAPPATGPNAPAGLIASADWRRPQRGQGWLWGLLGGGLALPLVAAGLFLGARVGRDRLAARPSRHRRRTEHKTRQRLAAAREQSGPLAFAEVERAVRESVARTGDTVDALPEDLQARAVRVLNDCEVGQFAPGLGPDLRAVIDEAAVLIDVLDAERRQPSTA